MLSSVVKQASRDMEFGNQAFRDLRGKPWDAYAAELMNMSETSPFKWFRDVSFLWQAGHSIGIWQAKLPRS